MASGRSVRFGTESIRRTAREDLDDASDGLGAVHARTGSAHDLDMIDLIDGEVLKGRGAQAHRSHADWVHEHEHFLGLSAMEINGSDVADALVVVVLISALALDELVVPQRLAACELAGIADA